jgi:hypothetical protein
MPDMTGSTESPRGRPPFWIVAAGALGVTGGIAWSCLLLGAALFAGTFMGLPPWEWTALASMIGLVIGGLGLLYGRRWAILATGIAAAVVVAAPLLSGGDFFATAGIGPVLLYYAMPLLLMPLLLMPLLILSALARDGRRVWQSS